MMKDAPCIDHIELTEILHVLTIQGGAAFHGPACRGCRRTKSDGSRETIGIFVEGVDPACAELYGCEGMNAAPAADVKERFSVKFAGYSGKGFSSAADLSFREGTQERLPVFTESELSGVGHRS